MNTTNITLVIPAYGNPEQLDKCLSSIFQHCFLIPVVVCIQGPSAALVRICEAWQGRLNLVYATTANNEVWPQPARNLAIPYIKTDYVWFLDSDLEVTPGIAGKHKQLLEAGAVISQGQVRDETGGNLWAAYRQQRGQAKYPHKALLPAILFNSQNVMMKTADWVAVRGFDVNMPGYGGDDIELGIRLSKELGIVPTNNKEAIAVAKTEKTVEKAIQQMYDFGNTNLHYITERHAEGHQVYQIDRLLQNNNKNRLMRAFLLSDLPNIIQKCMPVLPYTFQLKVIHILAVSAVWKGYIKNR